jgi:uncharacterized protein (DUF1800 family)
MSDERHLIAHLLRRTTFGPRPGQVEALVGGGVASVLDSVINAPAQDPFPAPAHSDPAKGDDMVTPWLLLMRRPGVGLHEKLVWFWHGHFTSALSQVDDLGHLYNQHVLHRRHALGNFRAYAQAITVDPAMLVYLNGDGSTGDNPNENYARELMELFTMGRGHYGQGDVIAAAKALAGWSVHPDRRVAAFDENAAYQGVVTYLGRAGRLQTTEVVDIACDHPATAVFISSKLHLYLVGENPSPARADELAAIFRQSGLEIRPLAEAILRHPSFLQKRLNRPRFPMEWISAAIAALGISDEDDVRNQVSAGLASGFGQVPFDPPSVAGWPSGNRWLAAGGVLVRAGLAVQTPGLDEVAQAPDPVAATLSRCSLYEVGAATRRALTAAASQVGDPQQRAATLLGLAIASPEFALA